MKKKTPKETASEKANPSPSDPVATGEQGEPVREWCGRKDCETDGEFYRRAFEWDAATLSGIGAASFERWRVARSCAFYGFLSAIKGGAGFDEILTRPEMLRAFECLASDPPQVARQILTPNPNPLQGGGSRETREWFISTIQEYADNIADKSGRVISEWFTPPWGMSLARARFEMFPICLNLAAVSLRETWGEFVTACGLPEFGEMREWLERDRVEAGRGYVQMPALYDCEFSEEQYFDLNTGESNAPKYGGGGVKAAAVLLGFRDLLRELQGVANGFPDPVPEPVATVATGTAHEPTRAANLSPCRPDPSETVGAAVVKKRGRRVGMSQAAFSALLKHYGGKCHGERYSPRIIQSWELWGKTKGRKGTEPPTAGGVKYCAALRDKESAALNWARNFNEENANAYNARKARV